MEHWAQCVAHPLVIYHHYRKTKRPESLNNRLPDKTCRDRFANFPAIDHRETIKVSRVSKQKKVPIYAHHGVSEICLHTRSIFFEQYQPPFCAHLVVCAANDRCNHCYDHCAFHWPFGKFCWLVQQPNLGVDQNCPRLSTEMWSSQRSSGSPEPSLDTCTYMGG